MSSKVLRQTPKWWQHSYLSWSELADWFSCSLIDNKACWKKLTQGQTNDNYCLTIPFEQSSQLMEQKYFVQIVNSARLGLLPQANNDSILNQLRNIPSIKPWLVDCCITTANIRVYQWQEGESITSDYFSVQSPLDVISPNSLSTQSPFLSSLVRFLTEMHNLDLSKDSVQKTPAINIVEYLERYRQLASKHTPSQSEKITQIFSHARELSKYYEMSSLCHNDLSLNNFLWNKTASTLRIIDWEYACYGDPIMDLANLITSCRLTIEQEKMLIKLYCHQTQAEISTTKLAKMKQLGQHINSLWEMASATE